LLLFAADGQVLLVLLRHKPVALVEQDHVQAPEQELQLRILPLLFDFVVDLGHELFLVCGVEDELLLVGGVVAGVQGRVARARGHLAQQRALLARRAYQVTCQQHRRLLEVSWLLHGRLLLKWVLEVVPTLEHEEDALHVGGRFPFLYDVHEVGRQPVQPLTEIEVRRARRLVYDPKQHLLHLRFVLPLALTVDGREEFGVEDLESPGAGLVRFDHRFDR